MKKLLVSFSLVLMIACLTSCKTSYQSSFVRVSDPSTPVLLADIRVGSDHVRGYYLYKGPKKLTISQKDMMQNAVYDAIEKAGCDVLVAPNFQIRNEKSLFKQTVTINVIGYPGFYTNFSHPSEVTGVDVKDLSNDKNYLISRKTEDGAVVGYQVIVPYDKNLKVIDMDEADVEKVVLSGRSIETLGDKEQKDGVKGLFKKFGRK